MSDRALSPAPLPGAITVGPWLVEPDLNRLSRDGAEVRVERKVMQMLLCLAADPGRTVTRQRLLDELWGYHVSDDALHSVVAKLRRALDRDGDAGSIETVPKVGYRLLLPVSSASPPDAGSDADRRSGQLQPGPPGPGRDAAPAGYGSATRSVPYAAGLALVVAGLVSAVWWSLAAAPIDDARPTRLVPLTGERGLEVQPAMSPGPGDRVAYAARGEGPAANWDLYVRGVSGGAVLRLTSSAASEHHPAWAADASRIAFSRVDAGVCEIWSVAPQGGDEQRLAPCPAHEIASLSWAGPDAVLVSARADAGEPFAIHRVPVDGSLAVQITRPEPASVGDIHARLSPDGRTLAVSFSTALGVQDIHLSDATGANRQRLTHDQVKIHGFDWAPDGRSIVFSSNRTGLFGIWRIGVDGGAPQHLAVTADDLDSPSVGADGDRIAYERWLTETSVHRAPLLTPAGATTPGDASPVLSFTRWVWHVDVSHADGALAVVSDRSGSPELWTTRADGSGPSQRTRFGGPYLTSPRWSPDGRRIAFVAAGRLRLLDVASSSLADLASDEDAGEARSPVWSPDGSAIYFASNRNGDWQVWRVDVATGTTAPVTTTGAVTPRVSADGQHLYFARPAAPGIWRRDLATGTETLVAPMLAPVDHLNWAVTARAVYYVQRVDDRATLHRLDLATGDDRIVRPLPGLLVGSSLAISRDERDVWFVRIDRQDADVMLLERPGR